jgi:hypothetical protein
MEKRIVKKKGSISREELKKRGIDLEISRKTIDIGV